MNKAYSNLMKSVSEVAGFTPDQFGSRRFLAAWSRLVTASEGVNPLLVAAAPEMYSALNSVDCECQSQANVGAADGCDNYYELFQSTAEEVAAAVSAAEPQEVPS